MGAEIKESWGREGAPGSSSEQLTGPSEKHLLQASGAKGKGKHCKKLGWCLDFRMQKSLKMCNDDLFPISIKVILQPMQKATLQRVAMSDFSWGGTGDTYRVWMENFSAKWRVCVFHCKNYNVFKRVFVVISP